MAILFHLSFINSLDAERRIGVRRIKEKEREECKEELTRVARHKRSGEKERERPSVREERKRREA